MIHKFVERPVLLGAHRSLVGIETSPAAPVRQPKPTLVILNTGIMHRVGHHRMFVSISRRLAQEGHATLRFDFSGIGDSAPRSDAMSPNDSALADIKEVVDWLDRERGAKGLILVGLCSGADHAMAYASTDKRVVGLILMDPTVPTTARYYVHYVAQRLIRLNNWISVLTGRSRLLRIIAEQVWWLLSSSTRTHQRISSDLQHRAWLEKVHADCMRLSTQMLVVFSGDSVRQAYREQLIEAFPNVSFQNRLRVEHFKGSDHTFSLANDRTKLFEVIVGWLRSMDAVPERVFSSDSFRRELPAPVQAGVPVLR
jgi:pimeloyl-ACP methyl ester carboxylesterase